MKWIGKEVMTQPIIGNITYVYTQNGASNTWVIDHNLGRFPSVTVIDSGDTVVIGSVVYNTINRITIRFFAGGSAVAFSGKAYLN